MDRLVTHPEARQLLAMRGAANRSGDGFRAVSHDDYLSLYRFPAAIAPRHDVKILVAEGEIVAGRQGAGVIAAEALAQQLRGEIFDMLQDGRSNEEITGFMVDRYGDFVLYRPPLQGNTLALWVMPLVVLLIGAVGVALTVGLRKGGMILSLLVLPLYVPLLIFAASAVDTAAAGLPVTAHLSLISALLGRSLSLSPLATAAALRISLS